MGRISTTILAIAASSLLGACNGNSPVEVSGQPAQTIAIGVGQELRITLGTVGPGEFVSPPILAGTSVAFIGMAVPGTQSPAGITQIFRFKGMQTGQTIIQFHNTAPTGGIHPDVWDTVTVR